MNMDDFMELTSEFIDVKPVFDKQPFIIAGPCSAETEEQLVNTAKGLAEIGVTIMRAGIWKPRTRIGGFEGLGEKGLVWFREAKQQTGIKLATEVATPAHVELALKYGVDFFWVGSRTSCDPFSVQALAEALKGVDIPVYVKNPPCPDLNLWIGALERIHSAGITKLGAIHRGFYSWDEHKYRNTPMWEVAGKLHSMLPNLPILFDPSHVGGKREYVAPLSQEAIRRGYDGLIVESHCNPDAAWTDASQQVTPNDLKKIMDSLVLP